MASQVINVTLPALPQGWSAEKDFTAVGTVSTTTQRNLEPVGPHFLAHARRVSTLISFLQDFVLVVQANKFTEAPPPYFLRGRKNPGPAERQED
jgi:DnaJ family protein C protein 2